MLSGETWQAARLGDLIEGQVTIGAIDGERFHWNGPEVDLRPEPALHLALVLHELVTNAHKYGALSAPTGRVELEWRLTNDQLVLDWRERGGPPVAPPSRRGFGTALIERSLRSDGGSAQPHYGAEGMGWTLTLPYASGPRLRKKIRPAVSELQADAAGGEGLHLGGCRLLLIEDEPLVAFELAATLEDAGGHVVGQAATVEDALALIDQGEFDLALLDGNLQGEGVERIARLLSERGKRFLFVSGYGRDHLPEAFDAVPAIEKPFKIADLLKVIGKMSRV